MQAPRKKHYSQKRTSGEEGSDQEADMDEEEEGKACCRMLLMTSLPLCRMLVVQGNDKAGRQASGRLLSKGITGTWLRDVDRGSMEVMMNSQIQTTSQVCGFCPLQQQVQLVILMHGSLSAHHVSLVLCR